MKSPRSQIHMTHFAIQHFNRPTKNTLTSIAGYKMFQYTTYYVVFTYVVVTYVPLYVVDVSLFIWQKNEFLKH